MPKASSRPPLPTSSSDFALPSSSNPSTPTSIIDDNLFHRFRRPGLLQKGGYVSEARMHPLASSFSAFHARRRSQSAVTAEETENERDKMMTDSSSSSETNTPPLKIEGSEDDFSIAKSTFRPPPLTPPRRKASMDSTDIPTIFSRRLAFSLKQHRILTLLAQEARPEDAEVKSEAAFQRLVASVSDLPSQPRTPRAFPDRGRYPEEAGREEGVTREETPSDDDEPAPEEVPTNPPPSGTQPINIMRKSSSRIITPAGSVPASVYGDDAGMSISETSSSFGAAMDVDMPLGSPLLSSMASYSINRWRQTPPPTMASSVARASKRKRSVDDRFDPYPSSSKRRAVSPSIPYLRDSHSAVSSPMMRSNGLRLPIAIPIAIPASAASSATSSPTIASNYPPFPRGIGVSSSPTLRATLSMASPILRPLNRRRLGEGDDEREIQGAGEAVNGLSLGPTLSSSLLEPSAQTK